MDDETTKSGTIKFVQRREPPVMTGDYRIRVTQHLQNTSKDPNTPDGAKFDESFIDEKFFSVRGERFTLDPTEIVAVFPPANNRGEYAHTLPHVVLARRTLPWENSVELAANGVSWLAILLFEQDEAPTIHSAQVGDLQRAAFWRDASQTDPALKQPSSLAPGTASYVDGFAALRATFDPHWGEHWSDAVQVIDIDFALFSAIAPSRNDLQWLAHVRTVASDNKAGGSANATQDNAVIISNRLPSPNTPCIAHLVSVEGMAPFLPDGAGVAASTKQASGNTPASIRLVTLTNWRFESADPAETFDGYLAGLKPGPLSLSYDSSLETAGIDADAAAQVKNAFALGYTAMPHQTRSGDHTVSWFRGPLAPFLTAGMIVPAPDPSGDDVIRVADQVTCFDPVTGMMDVSYAAAWELGRLLALQSPAFSVALHNWKCANSRRTALAVEHSQVMARFGQMLGAGADAAATVPVAESVHASVPAVEPKIAHRLSAAATNLIATRLAARLAPNASIEGSAGKRA